MKIKSQKGSITIFVLIALLFYTAFLLLMYAANTNKFKTITEKSDILKGIYEKNTSEESINNIYNKKNTEQLIAGIEKISLPAEYQQVAYLESTGTQYIKTNLKSSNDIFEFVASVESNQLSERTSQTALFGSTNGFNVSIVSNIYRATAKCITNKKIKSNEFDNIKLISDPNKSQIYLKINEYEKVGTYSNYIIGNDIGIFAYGDGGSISAYKLKFLKIMINDELKVSFIPCYRKADNKPGLYDLVNNEFYTNQGTGEFIVGPDID